MSAGRTTRPSEAAQGADALPLDIVTMRASANRLSIEGVEPLTADEADTVIRTLQGHLRLLIPEVEAAAGRQPEENIIRYCALACVGEARGKLSIEPRPGLSSHIGYGRRLSRSLNALCDHYENLCSAHPQAGQ